MQKGHNRSGHVAGDQLLSIIERVENLEERKAEIAADIKEVFAEAKGNGFDPKTIKHIIKLRKMEEAERQEYEGLIDIYKAALGMLDGTPLGEAAIRRLKKPEDGDANETIAEPEPKEVEKSIEEAREMGRDAAATGKSVTSNPFPARDPRRAAWDEAYCAATGSDGMDLPEAWRRKPKRKTEDEKAE